MNTNHLVDPLPEDEDRLAQPPLIDLAHFDADLSAYSITFVPRDEVSTVPTEHVLASRGTAAFEEIDPIFQKLAGLFSRHGSLERVVHGGGREFTFHFTSKKHVDLSEQTNGQLSGQALRLLKQLAEAAESAFLWDRQRQLEQLSARAAFDTRRRQALQQVARREKKRQR